MRVALLAFSLLFPTAVAPATVTPTIASTAIVQVRCPYVDGAGNKRVILGTAFRVGSGLMLTAGHVIARDKCFIGQQPVSVQWKAPGADFAMLRGDDGPFLTVDCGGFVKGRVYVAIGYARGIPTLTQVGLIGTGESDTDGQAKLVGIFTVVPGQSGGAIVDRITGRVVGVVNAERFEDGVSYSVALKDTPVCQGRTA